MTGTPYEFDAPEMLRAPVLAALQRVVDPEVAMKVVDLGLLYRVALVDGRELHLQVTMTSAACPMADVILEDIERELDRAVPSDLVIRVQLVWESPWRPDRLSDEARRFMDW
jgi:metal-sulfur cluster biosynthetic enzyme